MPANAALDLRRMNVDRFLSQVSIGIAADQELIGDQLLPVLSQDLDKALIAKWGSEAFVITDDEVGDRGTPKPLDISTDKVTVTVEGHARMAEVAPREQNATQLAAFPYDLMARKLYAVKQAMMLRREYLQATLLQNSALWSGNTGALTAKLGTPTSDPVPELIAKIDLAISDTSGRRPNTIMFAADAWANFRSLTKVRAQIMGLNNPQSFVTEAQVASFLGVDKVLVGRAVSRVASSGALNTRLWTNTILLAWVPPVTGEEIPALGYTVEQKLFGGASMAVGKWFDQKPGVAGINFAKMAWLYTPALLFPGAGYLFTAVNS